MINSATIAKDLSPELTATILAPISHALGTGQVPSALLSAAKALIANTILTVVRKQIVTLICKHYSCVLTSISKNI